jgi:quercetin dioxygenase-like cupin family protein
MNGSEALFIPTAAAPAFVFRLFEHAAGEGEPEHMHTLDHYTVVLSGAVEVTAEGETKTVAAPNCFVFRANVPHKITATKDGSALWQCLFILPEGYEADGKVFWDDSL